VGWFYKSFSSFALFGLVGWVFLVLFGLVSFVSLILVSLLIISLCVVFSFCFFGVSRLSLFLRLLFGAVFVVLFVEVAELFFFNVPVVLNFGSGVAGLHWDKVESSFANLAYPFLPYAYLLFVFLGITGFIVKVLPKAWFSRIKGRWGGSVLNRFQSSFEFGDSDGFGFLKRHFILILAILVSSIISCLFVVFTVLPWTNPTHMLVSVDSPVYYHYIVYMKSIDVSSALSFAFANDRALFLVLSYALSFVTSPLNVIQFAAAFLIVMFGVVSLLVLRLFVGFRSVWVLGVLLVPFSFQALGLIYSGYFANMLALILALVYYVLFFRVVGSWSIFSFFALLGVSVLILFSHSWTWFIFALSLAAFLFLEWRLAVHDRGLWGRFKVKAILVGATIEVGLLCDFIRKMLSPVSSTGSVISTVQSSLSFPSVTYLLNGMRDTVDFVLGGVFANQLLVLLSIVGLLVLLRFRSEVSNFLISWILVVCVAILFAAHDLDFGRFLFLVPWVVLSGLGLFSVVSFVGSRLSGSKSARMRFVALVLVFVFLVLLNGSLGYLSNINIW
jgi:hypothetical protein